MQLNSGIIPPYLMKVSLSKTTVCGAVNALVVLFLAIIQGRVVGVILWFVGLWAIGLSHYLISGLWLVDYSLWECPSSSIDLRLIIDKSALLFLAVVCFISRSVLIYCEWYINNELFKSRFLGLVLCFVGSIICLIFIPNFFTLLIGWDGLGLTSFLLVIYYQSRKRLYAGMITAVTNRVGDVLILCCLGYLAQEGS